MTEQAIQKKDERPPVAVEMTGSGIELRTIDQAFRFATAIVQADMAPGNDNAQAVLVKMQAGLELGMTPVQSMQSFVVVNGRLTMYGEAALGKIRAAKACEYIRVDNEGVGDARCGFVEFKRKDSPQVEKVTFTVEEAKRAGLWMRKSASGKDGPWTLYPDDMLVWRAVGRAAKRYFSDVLRGFDISEIVRDHADFRRSAPAPRELPPAGDDPLLDPMATAPQIETRAIEVPEA